MIFHNPRKKKSAEISTKFLNKIPKRILFRQQTKSFKEAWLSPKELLVLFNEKIQIHHREAEDNKIIAMYLLQFNPFAENLFRIIGQKTIEIISHVSPHLTYSSFDSNTLLCKFMNPSNSLYIILEGTIDLLMPNKLKSLLTKEEYFIYLLKLRRFNEIELLTRVININKDQFESEVTEKFFDNWVSSAYYWINFLPEKPKSKDKKMILKSHNNDNDGYISIGGVNFALSLLFNKSMYAIFQNEIRLTYQEIETGINNNKEIELAEEVSSSDYINRIKPIQMEFSERNNCKLVTLFQYYFITSKGKGESFGEMMCDKNYRNDNHKHYATIITSKQCKFCSLSRNQYNLMLKDIYEKGRIEKINFLNEVGVFNSAKSFVSKNFSTYFLRRVLKRKEYLFEEDESCEDNHMISFILKGEFKSICKKSLNEIGRLIKLKSSDKEQDTCLELLNKNKDYAEKKEIQLHSFGINDIVGLKDCVYNGIYLFSVQCSSVDAIIYQIHSKVFELIKNIEPGIFESITNIEKLKKMIIQKCFMKQRDFRIKTIINKVRSDNITSRVINKTNNIGKGINRLNNKMVINENMYRTNQKNRVIKSNKAGTYNENNNNNSWYYNNEQFRDYSMDNQKETIASLSKTQFTQNIIGTKQFMTTKTKHRNKKILLNTDKSLTQIKKKIIYQSNHTIDIKIKDESSMFNIPTCPSNVKHSIINNKEINYINPLIYDEFNRIFNSIPWYLGSSKNENAINYELKLTSPSLEKKINYKDYQTINKTNSPSFLFDKQTQQGLYTQPIHSSKYKRMIKPSLKHYPKEQRVCYLSLY